MKIENIHEIGINETGQLYLRPEQERFILIWRSATEVHWNNKENFLYSPKPREWSYLDWYKQIVSVVANEYNVNLNVTDKTLWSNIPSNLKENIIETNSGFQRPL